MWHDNVSPAVGWSHWCVCSPPSTPDKLGVGCKQGQHHMLCCKWHVYTYWQGLDLFSDVNHNYNLCTLGMSCCKWRQLIPGILRQLTWAEIVLLLFILHVHVSPTRSWLRFNHTGIKRSHLWSFASFAIPIHESSKSISADMTSSTLQPKRTSSAWWFAIIMREH